MKTDPAAYDGSRAILIGVSTYEHAAFHPIPAVRNSLQTMKEMLTDPALCGWPPERVTIIEDPASAAELGTRIADLVEETTGVLLLYYAGHGNLSERGDLCLTATGTRPDRLTFTGLPWTAMEHVLRDCPAATRIVILDCCFAGRAIEALGGDTDTDVANITHIQGVYTLAATTRNNVAHVPPLEQQGDACTSFTGQLCDLVRFGIPHKPAWLTLGDIYPALSARLKERGLPKPHQRGTDTVTYYPFARNAASAVRPTDLQAITAVVTARQLVFALGRALAHAVTSALAAASAHATAEDLGRELAREREADGRVVRAFHRAGGAVRDRARAAAGTGAARMADGLTRDRDQALNRAKILADSLALTLAKASERDKDCDEALARASSRAADLAKVLTSPSLRNLAEAAARTLAQTQVRKVSSALEAVHLDASGLDLSELNDVDATNLGAFVGVLWTDETIWPPTLAETVRQRSHEIRPGIYQVIHERSDQESGSSEQHEPNVS